MRRLSVLVVMGPVAQGGAEWQIFELLRRLDRERFRPVLASVEFDAYKELVIGEGDRAIRERYAELDIPHYRVTGHGRYGLGNLRELERIIRAEAIDVVHANLYAGETWGRVAALLTRTPIVTHKRGIPFKSRKPQNVLVDWLLNLASDRIIVVNPSIQRHLRRLQPLPAAKFSVILPGVAPALWRPASSEEVARLRRELGLEGGRVVTTVGRIRPLKGQRYLLEAIPTVLASCPDTTFLFVGHGAREAELRTRAMELGVEREALFLGGRSDVRELLSLSDVFALPSLSEASPIALMEAAFVGVPAVATCVGGVPDIVCDGETGLLAPPRDPAALAHAIVRLLGDPEERRRIAGAALARAREAFDIERTVQSIEAEYQRAVGLSC